MNEIIKNLESPAWWICVVVVSFIVNVMAAYTKPICDRIGASMSVRLRDKQKREAEQFKKDVEAFWQVTTASHSLPWRSSRRF